MPLRNNDNRCIKSECKINRNNHTRHIGETVDFAITEKSNSNHISAQFTNFVEIFQFSFGRKWVKILNKSIQVWPLSFQIVFICIHNNDSEQVILQFFKIKFEPFQRTSLVWRTKRNDLIFVCGYATFFIYHWYTGTGSIIIINKILISYSVLGGANDSLFRISWIDIIFKKLLYLYKI